MGHKHSALIYPEEPPCVIGIDPSTTPPTTHGYALCRGENPTAAAGTALAARNLCESDMTLMPQSMCASTYSVLSATETKAGFALAPLPTPAFSRASTFFQPGATRADPTKPERAVTMHAPPGDAKGKPDYAHYACKGGLYGSTYNFGVRFCDQPWTKKPAAAGS